ncbi:MAG TPA: single-stranded DNA-binding protein [Acidimicrobiia bacterium]
MSAPITLTGRLGADPELRFGASGIAVLKARIVTSGRKYDKESGKWSDVDTTWWSVSAFRELAENVAESLSKGDEVIVVGKVKQRDYETSEGEKRSVTEVTADHIGPSLRRASATVKRVNRTSSETAGRVEYEQAKQQLDDPWASEETPF